MFVLLNPSEDTDRNSKSYFLSHSTRIQIRQKRTSSRTSKVFIRAKLANSVSSTRNRRENTEIAAKKAASNSRKEKPSSDPRKNPFSAANADNASSTKLVSKIGQTVSVATVC